MEHRKRKRILYSVCFICLVLIDWIRGSQNGVCWQTAINLTGMFIGMIVLGHFRWKGETPKPYLIWMGIWLLGSFAGYGIWRIYPGKIFLTQYLAADVSVLFVGMAAVRIWRERKELEEKHLGNSFLLACWVILSVLMCCSRMGEIWQIWYAAVFLLFYMVPFAEEERRDLWDSLADGLIIGFFMLQIWAYGFRPYDELRYKGAFGNCNMNALFYMVTYIALLYRSHSMRWRERKEMLSVTWKRKLGKVILWILEAGIWGFLFLTMTRTALLAIIAITIIYGVIEFYVTYKEKFGILIVRGAALVLSAVVIFPAVYLTVRYLPTILHHPVWFGGEYSVDKVHSFDPANSEKYVSWEELFGGMSDRFRTGSDEDDGAEETDITYNTRNTESSGGDFPLLAASEVTGNMISPDMLSGQEDSAALTGTTDSQEYLLTGEAADSSARIRLEIYKLYLKNMNLTGHELEEGYFQITEDYHAWHAQNIFLQVGFYYGIIAGILFVIVMAGLGIQAFILACRKYNCEDLLPLLVWLLFVGYGMLECVWYPGQTILLLIYLLPKIIIDSRQKLQMNIGKK